MKYAHTKVRLISALLLTMLMLSAHIAPHAQARQARGTGVTTGVTKEEEQEARAVAAAFSDRLAATRDFTPVVSEFYASDFMSRSLSREAAWAARASSTTFMLDGVPALNFDRSLATRDGGDQHWPRLYVAAATLMHFIYLSLLSDKSLKDLSDPDKYDDRKTFDVLPPEAVKLLNANPTLANFLSKKGEEVDVKTPDELREVTVTLEEVVRMTRPRLASRLSKGKHLAQNLQLMKLAFQSDEVSSLPADGEGTGYSKDTRFFKVFSPIGYVLTLVKDGGRMKVAWATLPTD
jgi:hypothetical protein